jgi:hypothetical protein
MSKHDRKGRLPAFVPLFKDTLATPAWRAMSHGARSLYVALKLRHVKNNGRVYLCQRDACAELGSGFEEVGNWFRELEHYGFIVKTRHAYLGLNGKGLAPHWRLTELPCLDTPATRDFNRWDGVKYQRRSRASRRSPKTKTRYGNAKHPATEMLSTTATEMLSTTGNKCYGNAEHMDGVRRYGNAKRN